MTSEVRIFGVASSYALSYAYNLVGELESITNPWGTSVYYGYDKVGRVTGVNDPGGVLIYANALSYRAFGAVKGMNYGDGKSLSALYDNRLRPTKWDVSTVLGYNYTYNNTYLNETTGRVSYAQSIYDPTLDRSYEYDHVGRLVISHSGAEARAHAINGQWGTMDGPYSQGYDFDVWGNVTHKYGWGGEVQGGKAGQSSDINYTYTGNRRNGFSYDLSGNLTNDLGQTFTYDATGQQAMAAYGGYFLQQSYDGDGLRVKKNENGTTTYYLRSSVLGGQVVAEMNSSGVLGREYVYLDGQLLALRAPDNGVLHTYWVHEDPITKSKRVTDKMGTVVSTIELDPWGAEATDFSNNAAFQPKKFTSYERDGNGSDEAMFRRSNRWHSRFDQPDPDDGSYSLTNPQSFNRYAYVQGDPVNFVDPSGLRWQIVETCVSIGGDRSCATQGVYWIPDREPFSYEDYYAGRDRPRGGGGPQNPGRLSQGEVDQLRTDVANLLQGDCAKFMSALLNQLSSDTGKKAYSTNAMDVFKAVEEQGGFSRREGPHSASAGFTVGNGNGNIDINFPIQSTAMGSAMNGRVILHELVHVASGTDRNYDHYEMARAAYAVATAQGYKGLGTKPPDGDHAKLDVASSLTFNDILFKACHVK